MAQNEELDDSALDNVAGGALNAYLDSSTEGFTDPLKGTEQNVIHFINKVSEDSRLAGQIRSLSSEDVAGVVRVAAQAGFAFTAEQWQHVAPSALSETLTDAELDLLSGGSNTDSSSGVRVPRTDVWKNFLKH